MGTGAQPYLSLECFAPSLGNGLNHPCPPDYMASEDMRRRNEASEEERVAPFCVLCHQVLEAPSAG